MRQKVMIAVGLIAAVAVLWPVSAGAGILQLGQANIQGTNVTIPVVLQGDVGAGVSAMDFTFTYDPSVLEPVKVSGGAAASAADKDVQFNLIEPGRCKVVMMGLNQNVVSGGEVANVVMRRVSSDAGNAEVAVVDPTFADANASAIPSQGSNSTVNFSGDQQGTGGNTDGQQGSGNSGTDRANRDGANNSTTKPSGTNAGTTSNTPPASGGGTSTGTSPVNGGPLASLPKGIPMGAANPAAGTPGKPGTASMAKAMGLVGKVPPLPQGVQPTGTGGEVAAGQPDAGSAEPDAPGGMPEPAKPGVGEMTMNTPAAAMPGLPAGAASKAGAPAGVSGAKAPGADSSAASGIGVKWIGVGVIVVALAGLFALRRRLFT